MKWNNKGNFWKNGMIFWIFLYLFSLIPVLILETCNFPCADDLGFSIYTRNAWVDTHSLAAVIEAAWRKVAEIYQTWQGTWASIFLMALQPGIWGEQYYFVTTWLMLGVTSVSGLYLFHVIFRRCLGSDRGIAVTVSCIYLIVAVQCMVDKTQGFFWYNGAVHYMFPQAALFGLTGIVLTMLGNTGHKRKYLVIGILLTAYIGGGNLVTGLECGIWLITAIVLFCAGKKKNVAKRVCILLGIWVVSFGSNVLAPGNGNRQEEFSYRPGVVRSILQSFYYCLDFVFDQWMNWAVIALVLLVLPFVVRAVQNYEGNFRFRYPLLVAAYSYCILASMFTPSVYASGDPGSGRIYNIIFLTHLLLIVVNLVYFYGWYWKKYQAAKRMEEKDLRIYHISSALGVAFCFIIAAGVNQDAFTTTSALSSLLKGEAASYKQQQEERLELLLDETVKDAELKEFVNKPYLLYYEDIEADADNWKNVRMSGYYRKDTVKLAGE
ncbi:MAG: hypothetical protein Q4C58_13150 [Eubacteriales bacterium]|nr:hypothetical protein [Eubacteriales bacterium]